MAKNWKRAHDAEKAAREKLVMEYDDLRGAFDTAMKRLMNAEDNLGKALTLALGAAENLEAQGRSSSAKALRNAVDVLNPPQTMYAQQATVRQRT